MSSCPDCPVGDVIQDLADDLIAAVDEFVTHPTDPSKKVNVVQVHEVDQFLFEEKRLALPAVTVTWAEATAQDSPGRVGAVDFDLYFIAGMDREERTTRRVKQLGTCMLAQMRSGLLRASCRSSVSGRPWIWVRERSIMLNPRSIIHLQRWRNVVSTANLRQNA